MSMIPDETIEQVRDSVDLVGLIGEAVSLKRTGADYRGPCPFHGGTNRNFAVIPRKGRYYCFVCHESGDVFSWFMKRMGMSYPDAVREAARRVGIIIPERAERVGPDPLEPLYGAVAAAHDWFTRQLLELPDARLAREYLEGRDIPLETGAMLGLGFAPHGKAFLDAMNQLGIPDDVLLQAGLAAQRDDGVVSARFRGRLLFPIHDLRGRVVGFGGRLLVDGEPKYLNSPETGIFHKGKLLYNLHQAKGPIRKEQSVILVEGYFDVLRLVLTGVEHVVAPLGTALTPDQAALLKRFAPAATLLYDSDRPGLQATFRSGDELLRHGMRVRVATLPTGEDPDTLVKSGGSEALERVLSDAVDLLERKIQLLERKGWFADVEHQREALDRLLPTIRAAADPLTRGLYTKTVADRLGLPADLIQEQANSTQTRRPASPHSDSTAARRQQDGVKRRRRVSSAERELLRVLVRDSSWLDRAAKDVPSEWFETPELREIYEAAMRGNDAIGSAAFLEQLSVSARKAWAWLNSIEPKYGSPDLDRTYVDAVKTLEVRPLKRRLVAINFRLSQKLSNEEYESLVKERAQLKREITTRLPLELQKIAMKGRQAREEPAQSEEGGRE